MADLNTVQPYFWALIAGAVGWLFKTVIQLGKDVVAIQTAFKFYMETTAKGAAKVLDSPNPTPPEMRVLLRKYRNGEITKEDKERMRCWLTDLVNDPTCPKSERSAAIDILAAMDTVKLLPRRRWM